MFEWYTNINSKKRSVQNPPKISTFGLRPVFQKKKKNYSVWWGKKQKTKQKGSSARIILLLREEELSMFSPLKINLKNNNQNRFYGFLCISFILFLWVCINFPFFSFSLWCSRWDIQLEEGWTKERILEIRMHFDGRKFMDINDF